MPTFIEGSIGIPGQLIAHVSCADVHGEMQDHTRAHRGDSEPERSAMSKSDHRAP
jgi:hypothetical protein